MSIVLLILKIILYIILAVLGIIVVVLCLPVSAEAGFVDKKLTYKVRYWFINVFSSDGKGLLQWLKNRKKKPSKKKKPKKNDEEDFELPDIDDIPDETVDIPAEPEPIQESEPEAPVEEQATETNSETPEEKTDEAPDESSVEETSDESSDSDEPEDLFGDDDEEPEKKSGKSSMSKLDLVFGILEVADRPLLKIFKGFKFSEVYIDFIIANEDAYKCALNYGRISGAIYNLLGWLGTLCTVKYKTVDINPGFAQKNSRWDISIRLSFRPITVIVAGVWLLTAYIFRVFIPDKIKNRKLKKLNAARQK